LGTTLTSGFLISGFLDAACFAVAGLTAEDLVATDLATTGLAGAGFALNGLVGALPAFFITADFAAATLAIVRDLVLRATLAGFVVFLVVVFAT